MFSIYAMAGPLGDVCVDIKDTDPPVWGLHRSSEAMVAHLISPMNLEGTIGMMAIR
jgi:hypothetical protein